MHVNTSCGAIETVSTGMASVALGMPLAAFAQANPYTADATVSNAADPRAANNPCTAKR